MKSSIALTTLAAKFMTLLCVSGLSMMVMPEIISAAPMSPCHEMVQTSKESQEPCEMCEVSYDAWNEETVNPSNLCVAEEITTSLLPEPLEFVPTFKTRSLKSLGFAYSPPPMVALKAVTPITKTIVLRS